METPVNAKERHANPSVVAIGLHGTDDGPDESKRPVLPGVLGVLAVSRNPDGRT